MVLLENQYVRPKSYRVDLFENYTQNYENNIFSSHNDACCFHVDILLYNQQKILDKLLKFQNMVIKYEPKILIFLLLFEIVIIIITKETLFKTGSNVS